MLLIFGDIESFTVPTVSQSQPLALRQPRVFNESVPQMIRNMTWGSFKFRNSYGLNSYFRYRGAHPFVLILHCLRSWHWRPAKSRMLARACSRGPSSSPTRGWRNLREKYWMLMRKSVITLTWYSLEYVLNGHLDYHLLDHHVVNTKHFY